MSSCKQLSDEALAQLVRTGSSDAFVELSNRYLPLIRAKAASFHSFALEADDLWQEGLLGLFDAANSYRPDGSASFQTYAGVCISNRIVSAYRSSASLKNRILDHSLSLQDMEWSDRDQLVCSDGIDPETQVIARESVQAVNDHLNASLSPLEKEVLHLYLNGCTYQEIAGKLSISGKAADNAMQRVRRKLKRHLSRF
ncbi:MAG: sigma-70 family RNA polymerase sigma factor [Oscillospiraceae bacterium]|nr:sigma-70 family RNA polymerase sigma factor [Oscillospiraceae bacterium]